MNEGAIWGMLRRDQGSRTVLTLLMASLNGAGRLPRTLDAVARVTPPPGGWKVVVVDSASADGTAEAARGFSDRLPLTVLRSERRGKNAALNLGLPHLEGELLVIADDDVLPEPGWLLAYAEAAARRPGESVFGGAIVPLWPSPPPEWLLRAVPLGPTFAATGPDWPDGPTDYNHVWGPNMMLRASVLADGTRFPEGVGADGSKTFRMGSDVLFNEQLARRGHRFWHVPAARVGHVIRPEQMTRRWLVGRAFRYGRRAADPSPGEAAWPRLGGAPRWILREAAAGAGRGLLGLLRGDAAAAMRGAWDAQEAVGRAYEYRHRRRDARRAAPALSPVQRPLP